MTPPAAGPLGVVRDLAEHDPRPAEEIAAQYGPAEGPYLSLLYRGQMFCRSCGRRRLYCSCGTAPSEADMALARQWADDPEFREAFGPPFAFRLPR